MGKTQENTPPTKQNAKETEIEGNERPYCRHHIIEAREIGIQSNTYSSTIPIISISQSEARDNESLRRKISAFHTKHSESKSPTSSSPLRSTPTNEALGVVTFLVIKLLPIDRPVITFPKILSYSLNILALHIDSVNQTKELISNEVDPTPVTAHQIIPN